MDKFLEFFVDHIGWLIFFVFVGLVSWFSWVFIGLVEASNQSRANTRKLTEACYSQGLVLVNTDAGLRCADPRSLVKVK